MMKRLASVAAASLLAGAALFGTPATAHAGNSWDARSDVPDAGNSWDVRGDTRRLGDPVQLRHGNSWD